MGFTGSLILARTPLPLTDQGLLTVEAMAAVAEVVVGWAAEAGQTATVEAVTEALCAADRDDHAADQAMRDTLGDVAAVTASCSCHRCCVAS